MGAVVDACIALRLPSLELGWCPVAPAAVPELTRLIAAGALRELSIDNIDVALFGGAREPRELFVAAHRASAMTSLRLERCGRRVPAAVTEAVALINARHS